MTNLTELLIGLSLGILLALASLPLWAISPPEKPRTVCWSQTIPNVSMYHRVPCKGTITRYRS